MAKSKERERLLKIYGHLYSKFIPDSPANRNLCYYCGDMAVELDHLPSISNVEYFKIKELWPECDFLLVPCCRECNIIATDELDKTLADRLVTVKSGLKSKPENKRMLEIVDENYLDDMGHTTGLMRKSIVSYFKKGIELRERLKFEGYSGYKEKDYSLLSKYTVDKENGYRYAGKIYLAVKSLIKNAAKLELLDESSLMNNFIDCDNDIYLAIRKTRAEQIEDLAIKHVISNREDVFVLGKIKDIKEDIKDNSLSHNSIDSMISYLKSKYSKQ